jgi:hypothetical protein
MLARRRIPGAGLLNASRHLVVESEDFLLFDAAGMEFGHWRVNGASLLMRISQREVLRSSAGGSNVDADDAAGASACALWRRVHPVPGRCHSARLAVMDVL